jgi:hypothetical protein
LSATISGNSDRKRRKGNKFHVEGGGLRSCPT